MVAQAFQRDLAVRFPDRRHLGDSKLHQCQLVLIRMLHLFNYICKNQEIAYWITAGTLIGALRHRGMIPWDCDIDVGILEEDYEKLLGAIQLFPEDIFFQNHHTDPSYPDQSMAKLRDRYSNYSEWLSNNPEVKWHNGLQLDIMIYRKNALGQVVNPIRGTPYQLTEIFPLTDLEFESEMVSAPRNPKDYISRRYGDIMQLPAEDQRLPVQGHAEPMVCCNHAESLVYSRPES